MVVAVLSSGCFSASSAHPASATSDSQSVATVQINEPYVIEITGGKYQWHVRYPGVDGILATTDDVLTQRDIHVPLDTDVELLLKSRDFVYSLALPEFKLREIAVPELALRMDFHPAKTGQYQLVGDEFCGDPHPELTGTLFVESTDQFKKWLVEQHTKSSSEVAP
jgi:cytochrome c oxidase subunit II